MSTGSRTDTSGRQNSLRTPLSKSNRQVSSYGVRKRPVDEGVKLRDDTTHRNRSDDLERHGSKGIDILSLLSSRKETPWDPPEPSNVGTFTRPRCGLCIIRVRPRLVTIAKVLGPG